MSEQETSNNPIMGEEDNLSTGLQVLSFCIPLAGLIIYLINKDKLPNKAKAAGKMALIGFGIGIVLQIIVTVAAG